jgi:hypothetical protein
MGSAFSTAQNVLGLFQQAAGVYQAFQKPPATVIYNPPPGGTPGIIAASGPAGDYGASGPSGVPSEPASAPLGGRFVNLAGRALDAWRSFEALPTHPSSDILTIGQPDDREFAKLLIARGIILADSDVGQALALRGARPRAYSVKMSDGTTARIMGFPIGGGTRGSRRRNWNTPAKRRDAARTIAAMTRDRRREERIARRLAALAPKTRRAAPAPSRRKR